MRAELAFGNGRRDRSQGKILGVTDRRDRFRKKLTRLRYKALERLCNASSAVKCPNGRVIFVSIEDFRGRKLLDKSGDSNPPTLEAWRRLVSSHDWDIILDVGANYGEMVANVDLPAESQVIAIEPNPLVAGLLLKTIEHNQLPVTLVCVGVSNRTSLSPIDISGASSGRATLRHEELGATGQSPIVAIYTVDDLLKALSIDANGKSVLVKIDVEGHEPQVIEGAMRSFVSAGRVIIVAESLHGEAVPDGFAITQEIPSETRPDLTQDIVLEKVQ